MSHQKDCNMKGDSETSVIPDFAQITGSFIARPLICTFNVFDADIIALTG